MSAVMKSEQQTEREGDLFLKNSLEKKLVEEKSKGGSVADRKKVRAEKLEYFMEQADVMLGKSFDNKGWVPGTVDNIKKAISKVYSVHLSRDLGLPCVPGEM